MPTRSRTHARQQALVRRSIQMEHLETQRSLEQRLEHLRVSVAGAGDGSDERRFQHWIARIAMQEPAWKHVSDAAACVLARRLADRLEDEARLAWLQHPGNQTLAVLASRVVASDRASRAEASSRTMTRLQSERVLYQQTTSRPPTLQRQLLSLLCCTGFTSGSSSLTTRASEQASVPTTPSSPRASTYHQTGTTARRSLVPVEVLQRIVFWDSLRVMSSTSGVVDLCCKDVEPARTQDSRAGGLFVVVLGSRMVVRSDADKTTMLVLSARRLSKQCSLVGHSRLVYDAVALDPAAGVLASCSADATIRCWNIRTGLCLSVLHGHTSWIDMLAVLPDRMIVSASEDNTARLWKYEPGYTSGAQTAMVALKKKLCSCAVLPGPTADIVLGTGAGVVYRWSWRNGVLTEVKAGVPFVPYLAALSPTSVLAALPMLQASIIDLASRKATTLDPLPVACVGKPVVLTPDAALVLFPGDEQWALIDVSCSPCVVVMLISPSRGRSAALYPATITDGLKQM